MSAETSDWHEVSDCGLTQEQQAALPLDTRICLLLTGDPTLQERLYRGPDFNEMLAEKFGLDLKNSDDETKLQEARNKARHDGLIKFTPQKVEQEVPIVKKDGPTTRVDIHHMIQITVTAKGVELLAQEIDKLKAAD